MGFLGPWSGFAENHRQVIINIINIINNKWLPAENVDANPQETYKINRNNELLVGWSCDTLLSGLFDALSIINIINVINNKWVQCVF